MTNPVTVTVLVPQFKALHVFAGIASRLSDEEIEYWLGEAIQIHSYDSTTTLWAAAHLMALYVENLPADAEAYQDGGSRLLRAQQLGNSSETYLRQGGATNREFWDRTEFGRIFLEKEDRVLPPFMFVKA